MELLVEYCAKGFVIMLTISLPCVIIAAGIGLVVGILQAVTQVQEQTIAAAPKILLVFLTIIILSSWYIKLLQDFFKEGANLAFEILPQNESFVLPPNYFKYSKPFASEMSDNVIKSVDMEEMLKNPGKIPWANRLEKTSAQRGERDVDTNPNFVERVKLQRR